MKQKKWMYFIAFLFMAMKCSVLEAQEEKSILLAPLYGKTINVIGDSYVKNHRRPYEESWHCLVAEKYKMKYRNYGRNGRCLVFDRRAGRCWSITRR